MLGLIGWSSYFADGLHSKCALRGLLTRANRVKCSINGVDLLAAG